MNHRSSKALRRALTAALAAVMVLTLSSCKMSLTLNGKKYTLGDGGDSSSASSSESGSASSSGVISLPEGPDVSHGALVGPIGPSSNEPTPSGGETQPQGQPAGGLTGEQKLENDLVILDEGGMKVTVLGLDYSLGGVPSINLREENNSGRDVYFTSEYARVNGFGITSIGYHKVTDGETAENTIFLGAGDEDVLYGIEEIQTIGFVLKVEAASDDTIYAMKDVSLSTDATGGKAGSAQAGKTLYESDGILVAANEALAGTDIVTDEDVVKVRLFLSNDTDQNTTIWLDDISVNSKVLTQNYYSNIEVPAHCKCYEDVIIDPEDAAALGISGPSDVKSISMLVSAQQPEDADGYHSPVELGIGSVTF